ncbi:helix-turn-helix domain-containing protein [Acidovorax sp. Be4]|uniref:Helix-turn-helix domain-containing protein n=1 Tax=Acidovorax bellezanensis TaxID=2976702 RepID=A0ABT2PPQ7_9BURK|nr:helix-turn-helix domain-containing protein [Acidovorax sp. Be4]MCT9812444.1 helix-turn-helix domain-containing protein [Acidovorax sp. Be4]
MKHAALARQASDENGGPTALARKVGRTPSEVSQWISGVRPIPMASAALVESVSSVTRKQLFPDDWAQIWPELITQPQEAAHG